MSLADKLVRLAFVGLLGTYATGCIGASTEVVADGSKYPLSFSRGVRDADGSLLPMDQRVKVGEVHVERRVWALVYGAVELDPKTDISDDVNMQIEQNHGDAVVNLKIANLQCPSNAAWMFNHLPMFPGCTVVTVTGDIIKKKARTAAAAPAAPQTTIARTP